MFIINKETNKIDLQKFLDEICLIYFNSESYSIEILDINFFYTKILIEIKNMKFYLKYSKSKFFIHKDYSINRIFIDTDALPKPICFDYLKSSELYYSITTCDSMSSLKDNLTFKSPASKIVYSNIKIFNSYKIESDNKIMNFENFIKAKYNFNLLFPLIKRNHIDDFNEIASSYSVIRENLLYKFSKIKGIEQNILNHGNLNEYNIAMKDEKIIFTDFENAFWGNSITDMSLFFINTLQDKLQFISFMDETTNISVDKYLEYYELCFFKKSLDFIIEVILCYIFPEKKFKPINSNNELNLSFFSTIEEFKKIVPFLKKFLNHSNV